MRALIVICFLGLNTLSGAARLIPASAPLEGSRRRVQIKTTKKSSRTFAMPGAGLRVPAKG